MKWYNEKIQRLEGTVENLKFQNENLQKRIAEMESTMPPKRFKIVWEEKTDTGTVTRTDYITADAFDNSYSSSGFIFGPMTKIIQFKLKGQIVGAVFTDPTSIMVVDTESETD